MKLKSIKWSKYMALALCAALMTTSLAGCGGDKTTDNKEPQTNQADNSKDDTNTDNTDTDNTDATDEGDDDTETPEDESPYPAYDFGGQTITLLEHNDLALKNPDQEDDSIEDYERDDRRANLERVEKKYNVKLEFVKVPTDVWEDIPKEIISAYAAGQPVADVMDCYFQFLGTYVANDILYDMSDAFKADDTFNSENFCTWMSRQWGVSMGMSGEGIFYNKDMIKKIGMEKTPAEMFNEGKWSYDDFYNYCAEMKSKMGENEYPFFVSPYYWMLFASAANGVQILGSDGNLNYLDPAMLETMEFLQKLVNDGLCRKPNMNEDGTYDTWGTGGVTFDAGVEVAMAHRAIWQIDPLVGKFDIGFVPYPWGSNVSIEKTGEAGAYKTLSDTYQSSYFDGQVLTLTKGVEKKADPIQVMTMVTDLMEWNSASNGYVEEETSDSSRWFNDELDAELYNYSGDIERWEPYNSLDIETSLSLNKIFYGGESLRSNFESYYNADMAAMIEAGYATADVMNGTN